MKTVFRTMMTMLLWCATAGYAKELPAGIDLLDGMKVEEFTFGGTQSSRTTAAAEGMPFTTALKLIVAEKGKNPWDVRLDTAVKHPGSEGDAVLLVFYARANSSEGTAGCWVKLEEGAAPYKSAFSTNISMTTSWTRYVIAGTVPKNLAAGGWKLSFQIAQAKQELEISGVSLVDYGKTITAAELIKLPAAVPVTKAPVTAGSSNDIIIDFESGFTQVSIPATGKCKITGEIAAPLQENSSGWADVDYEGVRLSEGVFKGNGAQRIIVHDIRGGAAQLWMPAPLLKGSFTKVSLALRTQTAMTPKIMFRMKSAPYKPYWEQQISVSPEWRQFDYLIPPFAADTNTVFMIFLQPGSLDIDELSIRYMDENTLLASVIPLAGNLLPASSFPAGLTGYWNFNHGGGGKCAAVPDEATPGPTGFPALKIGIGGDEPPYAPMGSELVSPAFIANGGKKHTFSMYAKASSAGQSITVRFGDPKSLTAKTFSIGTEWKRYSFTEKMPFSTMGYYNVRINASQPTWIDGLMLEESETLTDFKRVSAVELSVKTSTPYGLHTDGQPLSFELAAFGALENGMTAKGAVFDMQGRSYPVADISLAAGKSAIRTVTMPPSGEPPFGTYRVEMRVYDRNGKALSKPAEVLLHRVRTARMAGKDAPESPFGIHINATAKQMRMAKMLGFNWARCHDASGEVTKWFFLEKEQGKFDFADADAKVELYRKNNMLILGTLDTSPRFYSACPADFPKGYSEKTFMFKPEYTEQWKTYCRTITSRYKGKIDHWEVWNEPYVNSFFRKSAVKADKDWNYVNGTPDDYVPILQSAFSAAKEGNPECTVLWANAPTVWNKWNEGCVRLKAYDHCDKYSFHYYSTPVINAFPGDPTSRYLAEIKGSLSNAGKTLAAWNTEGGPGSSLQNAFKHTPPFEQEKTVATIANYIVRYYVSMLVNGVDKFFLYTYHAWAGWMPSWDVLAPDGSLPPSATALSSMMWHLEGKKYRNSVALAPGWYANVFEGGGESTAVIVGSGASPKTFAEFGAGIAADLYGNPVQFPYTLSPDSVLYLRVNGSASDLEKALR